MRRYIYLITALSVVLAACGSSTVSTTSDSITSPAAGGDVAGTETTVQIAAVDDSVAIDDVASTTDPTDSVEPTDFDGPAAEDFSIELNRSGLFTLSAEARPVYLVFWAEW